MEKEDTIVYDVISCLNGWTIETLFNVWKKLKTNQYLNKYLK